MEKSKKTVLIIGIIFLILLIVAVLGGGIWYFFIREKGKESEKTDTSEEQEEEKDIQPLKLTYEISENMMGGSKITIWIVKKEKCSDRDAYLGIMNMDRGDQSSGNNQEMYAKFTIYEDNGEFVATDFTGENELAFDDMKPQRSDSDIFVLTLNSFFAYAGKNFNTSDLWNSDDPVVLNDVYDGNQTVDLSIIREEARDEYLLPCQNFKLITRGSSNMTAYVCVVEDKKINDVNVPFVVNFEFADQGQNSSNVYWKLIEYKNEEPSITWISQCLEPVKCEKVEPLTTEEENSCKSSIGSQVEEVFDDSNCLKEYRCMTADEIAERDIERSQRPGCPIDPNVKSKIIECKKNVNFNWEGKSNNEGCLIDITCTN